jgi:hypothetical protein
MQERWIPVVGYEGLYEVSDAGRVKSLVPSKKRPIAGHVLTPKRSGQGYLCVALYRHGKPTTITIHQLVMRAFVGAVPDGMNVNHRDGKKKNNLLSNLEYVSYSENSRHALSKGLSHPVSPRGQANGNASITETQAISIAQQLHAGERPCNIAREMGISAWPVYDIKARRKWQHLFAAGGPLAHLPPPPSVPR